MQLERPMRRFRDGSFLMRKGKHESVGKLQISYTFLLYRSCRQIILFSSATGTRLILEAILYQGFYEDGGPWFYTTLEPWEASVSDGSQVEISESDAAQIMENHPYASIAFEAIPAV